MAQRRMFSNKITDTDTFLDMPASAQNLYFHLNMHADNDGFLGNAKTIRRMIGASEDDLKILVAKRFLLMFDDGVTVIRDWRIHNYIQKDRYHQTMYQEHKKQLTVNHNHQYEFVSNPDTKGIQDGSNSDPKRIQSGSNVDPSRTQNGSNEKEVTKSKNDQTPSEQATEPMDPECIQDGSKMDPQVRVRLGKSKVSRSAAAHTREKNYSGERPFDLIHEYHINANKGEHLDVFLKAIDSLGEPLVCWAIHQTADGPAPQSFGYLNSIFKRLQHDQITSVEEAEIKAKQYKNGNRRGYNNQQTIDPWSKNYEPPKGFNR